MKLPEQFENRMKKMLGTDYEDFIKSYDENKKIGLRVNELKMSIEDFRQSFPFETEEVPWCETGFVLSDSSIKAGREALHDAGAYYIQEPSAMSVASSIPVEKGMKVLDLCAAPGGKSTQLAGFLANEGVLVSNEINPTRAKILSSNIERLGIRNCLVTNESPDRLLSVFEGYFDVIVVDAPCSGEGMFRKDDTAIEEWSEENVEMCAKRQRDILECAEGMLKPGGIMAYSTCTFAPKEDEENMAWFLQNYPNFHVFDNPNAKYFEAAGKDFVPDEYSDLIKDEVAKAVRLWPHKIKGEGHFVCLLKKDPEAFEEPTGKSKAKKLGKSIEAIINSFIKENLIDFNVNVEDIIQMDERVILRPKDLKVDVSKLHIVRMGLELGEIKKDRFEPAHSLAMALSPKEVKRFINLSAEEALKYRHGEELRGDFANGWTLVCVNNVSLGWGKASNGLLKNHYPKGLRIKY